MKIDRKKCLSCTKSLAGRAVRPIEYYMFEHQDSFICPTKAITSYYRDLRLKWRAILEAALPPEEFKQVRTVECHREANGRRFDQEPPEWCPHKKYHANWAKRGKREET